MAPGLFCKVAGTTDIVVAVVVDGVVVMLTLLAKLEVEVADPLSEVC